MKIQRSAVSGQRSVVLRILLFIFSFLILTRFYIDPDLGWHLAIGKQYLSTGEIIGADQFSWTMPGHIWQISYFGYQLLIAYLFKNFALFLIAGFFGLIGSLAVLTLIKGRVNIISFLIIGLGIGLSAVNLGIRPHMFSFLLFAIFLRLLEKGFFTKMINAFLWFFIFVFWVNFHQGFLVGLLVFGIYLGVDFLWNRVRKRDFALLPSLTCLGAAFLATFVNPYGAGMWMTILKDSSDKTGWTTIAEFMPIVVFTPANLLFALSGVVFIYIFLKKFRQVEPHFFLIGALLFASAFIAAFMVFFWVAIFIFIASRYIDFNFTFKGDFFAKLPVILAAFAVSLAFVLNFVAIFLESYKFENLLIKNGYPIGAVEFLKDKKQVGNMFNEYAWGGFIDWQYPAQKVFIDGRMAGWKSSDGRRILSDYLEILGGNCSVFNSYDISVVLVKRDFGSQCFGGFSEVYTDEIAKVLIK